MQAITAISPKYNSGLLGGFPGFGIRIHSFDRCILKFTQLYRDANHSYVIGGSLFCKHFCSILTPEFCNVPISGKFCPIEVACNFENPSIFCLNPPYFLDVNVGISTQ